MKKYLVSLIFLVTFITPAFAADIFPIEQPSQNTSLWAYMNEDGSLATSFQYTNATAFNEYNLAAVTDINDLVSVINENLETVVPPQKTPLKVEFSSDMIAYIYPTQTTFFLIDGTPVGTFEGASGFFNDELLLVKRDGLYGYVNKANETIIEPKYTEAGEFFGGFAVVKEGESYSVINTSGIACVLPEDIIPHTLKVYEKDTIIVKNSSRYALYSLSGGTLITEYIYQEIMPFENGFACARVNNLWGTIDPSGKTKIPFQYYDMSYMGDGLYAVKGSSSTSHNMSVIDTNATLIYRTDVYAGGFDSMTFGIGWHGTMLNQVLFFSKNGGYLGSFDNAENPTILTDDIARITIANKVHYVRISDSKILYTPERVYNFELFSVSSTTYEKYFGIDENGNDKEWKLTYPVISSMSNKIVQNKINEQIRSFFLKGPNMYVVQQSMTGSFGLDQVGRLLVVWADCVYGTGDGSAIWNSSITFDLSTGEVYDPINDLLTSNYVDVVRKYLPEEIPFYLFSSPRITPYGLSFFYLQPQDINEERYSPTSKEYTISYSSLSDVLKKDTECYRALLSTAMGSVDVFIGYTDVSENHWAYEAIKAVTKVELMAGDGSSFYPEYAITGVEIASVMVRALDIDTSSVLVPDGSEWYYQEVTAAKNAGLLSGTDENTLLNAFTRADTMQLLKNALYEKGEEPLSEEEIEEILSVFPDNDKIPENRREAAAVCVKSGLIVGNESGLDPNSGVTRAQFAQILKTMLNL